MKVIIEIPKGDTRRRHLKYDKSGFIDLGPISEVIPVNNGIMPIHYGYIPGTLNKTEGDEIDVLIFSRNDAIVGEEIEVYPIALIRRADGDDKIIAVDESTHDITTWEMIPEDERMKIQDFFSYHHPFRAIVGKEEAEKYIHGSQQ